MLTLVLLYALVANVVEKPDGIVISGLFILGIVVISVVSRLSRAFELRVTDVEMDRTAQLFVRDAARRTIRLVANEPNARDAREYVEKRRESIRDYGLDETDDIIFVEITVTDPSAFASRLDVQRPGHARPLPGADHGGHERARTRWPRCVLHVRDVTGRRPHLYVEWTEGNPVANLARFLFAGGRRGRPDDARGAAPGRAGPHRAALRAHGLRPRRSRARGPRTTAEVARFELAMGFKTQTRLAGGRHRPD